MEELNVYPLGVISQSSTFCDVLDTKGNHVCCISWTGNDDNLEEGLKIGVHWDDEGYPDIVVNDKWITLDVMKEALKTLERDPRNKYHHNLIKKNWFELVD